MPKHSVINEYKWAILAMLGNAKLPRIGKSSKLKLRACSLDDGTISLHINIPWLLEGEDVADLPARRSHDRWGWEVVAFHCQGRKLTRYGYVVAVPTGDVLDMADPSSNERLLEIVKFGIERAYDRQVGYLRRKKGV